MRDVRGEFGLINVHLFDVFVLPIISSRKVAEKSDFSCLENGKPIYMNVSAVVWLKIETSKSIGGGNFNG